MISKLINLIDFERINSLLEGFNKTTGFVTAILDLEGNVLSKSGWRSICTDFHRVNTQTAKKCTVSDTELANKMAEGEKYHFYKCLNGLVDVAVPLIINGEHIANLFSGQFFFEEPDRDLFLKQATKYGFDNEKYMKALAEVPVISEERVKTAMDFLLDMTKMIAEITLQRIEQIHFDEALHEKQHQLNDQNKELQKAKENAEASEKYLNLILNNIGDPIFVKDDKSRFLLANDAFCSFFSLSRSQIISKTLSKFVPSEEWTSFLKIENQVLKDGIENINEKSITIRGGQTRTISTRNTCFIDDDGNKFLVGAIRDITNRKLIEDSLLESETRLKFVQKSSGVGLWDWDMQTNHLNWSSELFQMFGFNPDLDQATFENWDKCMHPDDKDLAYSKLNDSIKNHLQLNNEYRVVHPDGKELWINAIGNTTYGDDGKPVRNAGICIDITTRNQAKEALIEKERLLSLFITHSPIHAYIKEVSPTESRVLMASENFNEMIGIAGSEIIGKTMFELFPAEFAEKITADDWEVASKGTILKIEETLNNRYYTTIKFPIKSGDKNLLAGYTIDLTESKRLEEILRKSENKNRNLLQNLHAGVVVHAADSSIILANEQASRLLGLSHDQLMGKTVIDPAWHFVLEDLTPASIDQYPAQYVITNKIPLREMVFGINRPETNDLIWVLVNAFPEFETDGSLMQVVVTFIDITERKQAQDKLINANRKTTESEIKYRNLFSKMMNAFGLHEMIFDQNGKPFDYRFLEVNPAWETIVGLKREMVLGKTIREIMPEIEESWIILYGRVVDTGIPEEFEEYNRATGKYYHVYAYRPEPGKFAVLFNDLTDRKEFELQLSETNLQLQLAKEHAEESDRLKSAFLANMSHELRTPLNAIIGFSELIIDPEFDFEQHADFAQLINDQGNNLLSVLSDIMDISKIEAGQIQIVKSNFSVNQFVVSCQKEFSFKAEKKGIELKLDPANPKEEITIHSDSSRINQILTNLVVNAIKFTVVGFVEIGFEDASDAVQFHVKDTGIGIAKDYHSQIFDRFKQVDSSSTRNHGGNGLGLAISKNLVEMLGGTIWLESEVGKGSVFYFNIPKK